MIGLLIVIIAVLVGASVGALFALGFIKVYRKGVVDGRAIDNELPFEPMFEKKTVEEADPMMSAYETIANYDPFNPPKGEK